MSHPSYQERLDQAGEAFAEALRRLAQAPRGLKPYRRAEADEARRALRELVRYPNGAHAPAPTEPGQKCWCGARVLLLKDGPVCSTGQHDD